jgi:hypothetical protein
MPDFELTPPLLGLSDEQSYHNQPQGFTRDARNARPTDARSGRRMPASRAGRVKANPNLIDGGNAIKWLGQVPYPNPASTTWTNAAAPAALWAIPAPSKGPSKCLVVDAQDNVYALDGTTGVIKTNSAKKQLWKLGLTLKDPQHKLRSLAVDPLTLDVFCGLCPDGGGPVVGGGPIVENGGDQTLASIWCYQQLDGDKVELRWELPIARWAVDMKLHAPTGRLYVLTWDSLRYRSHIQVYRGLQAAAPDLEWEREVSARARCIQVKFDGSVLYGADPFDLRGQDPKAPGIFQRTTSWTLKNLPRYSDRVHLELHADAIDGPDSPDEYKEGDEIIGWLDHSGNDRNLYASSTLTPTGASSGGTIMRPPLYTKSGLGGLPSLNFLGRQPIDPPEAGGAANGFASGMESLPNASTNANYQAQQRGLLPAFTGSQFVIFILCRPKVSDSTDTVASGIFPVFGQQNKSAASVAGSGYTLARSNVGVHLNRSATGNLTPGVLSNGKVSAFEITDPTAMGGNSPDDAPPPTMPAGDLNWVTNNTPGACLITYMNAAGVSGNSLSTTQTRSLLRVNGLQADRYASYAYEALVKATIGWIMDPASEQDAGFFQGEICDIIVMGRRRDDVTGALTTTEPYILSHPVGTPATNYIPVTMPTVLGGATVTATNNEMEMIEGWLMHHRGCQRYLDTNHPWRVNVPPAPGITTGSQQDPRRMHTSTGVVGKLSAQGEVMWIASDERSSASAVTNAVMRGVGLGMAVSGSTDADGNYTPNDGNAIFCLGSEQGLNAVHFQQISDQGNFYTSTLQGGLAGTPAFLDPPYHLACDQKNNFWVPMYNTDAGQNFTAAQFNTSGPIVLLEIDVTSGGSLIPGYACAVPLTLPQYPFSMANQRAQFLYLGTSNANLAGTTGQNSIHKYELVTSVTAAAPPRLIRDYAISTGGLLTRFSATTVANPLGLVAPQLAATSQYFDAVVLKDKLFVTDGKKYIYLRPEQGLNGFTYLLESKSAGEPKPYALQLAAWNGRLVFVTPTSIHMAGQDDPFEHDLQPPDITPASAFDGSVGPAAQPQDLINTFIPIRDDLAIVGCDKGIYRLTGNPQGGGVLDLISTETGMSFGRSWCLANGVLYFHGSRGGIWSMPQAGGEPRELTRGLISSRMRLVDLSQFRIALAWNDHPRERGLYVIPIPFGASNTFLRGWFMDAQEGGWWEDSYQATAYPTAVAVFDGDDPSDRRLVFGCSDGFVREFSPTAKDDDGLGFHSYITYPMLRAERDGADVEMEVLHTDVVPMLGQDSVSWQWLGGEHPEKGVGGGVPTGTPPVSLGSPLLSGVAQPGGSRSLDSTAGRYLYLRVGSSGPGRSWAMERVTAKAYAVGRSRVR